MQYPTIAQPQYGFGPTMPPGMYDTPPALMNFKKGGDVEERRTYGLENAAEMLRRQGRDGDTILAHINPQEAGILKLLGGSGTINPYTGLPEFKFLKKIVPKPIYKLGSKIGKELERGIESIARNKYLGPIAQMASYLHPVSAALYAGLAPEGSSFDVKRAAKAAALQQIGEAAYEYAQGAPGDGLNAFSDPVGDISDVGSLGDLGYTAPPPAPSVVDAVAAPTAPRGDIYASARGAGGTMTDVPVFDTPAAPTQAPISPSSAPIPGVGANAPAPTTMSGLGSLASEVGSTALKAITPTSAKDALLTASLATTAYGSVKSLQELEDQKEEAERILAAQEGKKQEDIAWAQGVLRDYPVNYRRLTAEDVLAQQGMAGGGLASLNAFKSGGEPRFLKGGGDGMSDDIPATIGGRQKAALSDGEFVIPADVVSHLGNGSSRAGAKKLYKMMDNIRRARTGKRRQAPKVSADRYMPA